MKVIFLDNVHPVLQEDLTKAGFQCDFHEQTPFVEVEKIIHQYDGIVIRSRMPMNQAFLEKAANLKFIARSGAGMENIDEPFCEQHGIVLFNAPEGNRDAVGEHAIGMLLALFNQLTKSDRQVRSGIWDREGNRGHELSGETVGIIGYGNNGGAFAKKLTGFDCEILAYDKYKSGFGTNQIQEVDLAEIFERADVLSFHIPQNEETMFMCDEEFLSKFKKPIYIINLARGKIVKTDALVSGLKSGTIFGACLDVLEYEKASFEKLNADGLPDAFQYLMQSDKVLLTPHVGGWTHESYYKLSKVLADKILSYYSR